MADEWHTYSEAAEALGMSVEGLRQRVRRENWRKMTGNDGKVRVVLPDIPRSPLDRPTGDHADTKAGTTRSPSKQPPASTAGELSALKARIDEMKSDLERERGERIRERDRADRLSDQLTEAARELARAVQEGAERERDLRDKLDAARASSSSWWRFRRSA